MPDEERPYNLRRADQQAEFAVQAGWHAGKAKQLLQRSEDLRNVGNLDAERAVLAAQAQVHATLALYELEKMKVYVP